MESKEGATASRTSIPYIIIRDLTPNGESGLVMATRQ